MAPERRSRHLIFHFAVRRKCGESRKEKENLKALMNLRLGEEKKNEKKDEK